MEENKPFAISQKLLLSVYGIIPIVLLLVLLDTFVFDTFIKKTIGLSAISAAVYILFLELPHIIGSFISYADSEYVRFYRKQLFFRLPLLLLAIGVLLIVAPEITFAAYLIYTMYHSIRQQTGIASILVGKKSYEHTIWNYGAIGTAVVGNFYVFAPTFSHTIPEIFSLPVLSVCIVIFIVVTLAYLRSFENRHGIGFLYVIATSLLLIASYLTIVAGYFFFAVFLIRFVHDVTAFIFYSVHDSNRNSVTQSNFFYKISRLLHIPLLLVTPIFAIVIAHLLRTYSINPEYSAAVLIILGCAHYYIESFMWKHESLHRKQLRFTQ